MHRLARQSGPETKPVHQNGRVFVSQTPQPYAGESTRSAELLNVNARSKPKSVSERVCASLLHRTVCRQR